MIRSHLQFALAAVLLTVTALFLQARGRSEVFPPRQPLSSLPHELANWVGTDITLPKDTLEILGPGDFLLRLYRYASPQNESPGNNPSRDVSASARGIPFTPPGTAFPAQAGHLLNPSGLRFLFPAVRHFRRTVT